MALQQITIEIPDKVFLAEKTDTESFGRASELAGMSRVEFLLSLSR